MTTTWGLQNDNDRELETTSQLPTSNDVLETTETRAGDDLLATNEETTETNAGDDLTAADENNEEEGCEDDREKLKVTHLDGVD